MNIDFIDLGLPSGTLWMKQNIGAETETDYGSYFQWGDTVGYTDASHSTWSTCPGNDGNEEDESVPIAIWDSKFFNNNVLKTDVDAAYVHTNGKAKIPTKEQYQELLDETTQSWEENFNGSGINGVKFVNKNNSSKYIFIPASGYTWNGKFYCIGYTGSAWSCSACTSYSRYASYFYFNRNNCGITTTNRIYGQCIRGIKNKELI